ncbi:hypothetical protein HMPREF1147_2104 [Selenomonas sp. FOBRC9]|nr:hypothetical protein HMPREF1147_2104 [Selenomonas sp. FOBRC9]
MMRYTLSENISASILTLFSEKEISEAGLFSYFLIFSAHCAMITKT